MDKRSQGRPATATDTPAQKVTPSPALTQATKDRANQVAAVDSDLESEARAMHELVARRAYLKALARGFQPGHELEDWLQAEEETRAALRAADVRRAAD